LRSQWRRSGDGYMRETLRRLLREDAVTVHQGRRHARVCVRRAVRPPPPPPPPPPPLPPAGRRHRCGGVGGGRAGTVIGVGGAGRRTHACQVAWPKALRAADKCVSRYVVNCLPAAAPASAPTRAPEHSRVASDGEDGEVLWDDEKRRRGQQERPGWRQLHVLRRFACCVWMIELVRRPRRRTRGLCKAEVDAPLS
jgi:hypothetical protein